MSSKVACEHPLPSLSWPLLTYRLSIWTRRISETHPKSKLTAMEYRGIAEKPTSPSHPRDQRCPHPCRMANLFWRTPEAMRIPTSQESARSGTTRTAAALQSAPVKRLPPRRRVVTPRAAPRNLRRLLWADKLRLSREAIQAVNTPSTRSTPYPTISREYTQCLRHTCMALRPRTRRIPPPFPRHLPRLLMHRTLATVLLSRRQARLRQRRKQRALFPLPSTEGSSEE